MAIENRCIFGTNLHSEVVEETLTKYGRTIKVANLELHAGNSQYAKRSDAGYAFVFDRDDCRYQSLRKNIGIFEVPHVCGCLVGCLVGFEDGVIRFRIKEDEPSHLLMCCIDSEHAKEVAKKANPDAISDYSGHRTFFVVYSLARPNPTNCNNGDEHYDDYYDEDPDGADVYDGRYDGELGGIDIIRLRLKYSGF